MSAVTPALGTRRPHPVRAWLGRNALMLFAMLVLLYLFVPILIMVGMSFSGSPTSSDRSAGYSLGNYTLENWKHPCAPIGMCAAVGHSLEVGAVATLVATLLGTLVAVALVRHRFRGRGGANVLIFLPMATPDVVMGISLLTFFVNLGLAGSLGFGTVVVAHIMFCLSYVVNTVKARLAGMDPRLEEAASDLYASPGTTFWKVTFPLLFPGILSAALLAFSLSFDDFVITNFTTGSMQTFPLFVWGSAQRNIPKEINVVGTIMLLIALAVVLGSEAIRRRGERQR